MNPAALEYLACPQCGSDVALEDSAGPEGGPPRQVVACTAGCGSYPVCNGVPRLLTELTASEPDPRDCQKETCRSFGAQWDLYQYGNTTWGVTVEERIDVVLHELQWSESDLPGKVILDAGCGNGTLSKALAQLGAIVVAVDLSPSVFRAQQHCPAPRVHYVQGNLFFPPLKQGVFDAIYSCGVFHHTPDTRRCFDALLPTLKQEDGSRYFIWLYSKRSPLFNMTVEPLMKLTRRMPSGLLGPVCRALAPPVEAGSRLLTMMRAAEYAPRNLKDRTVQLHDLLVPQFVHYHSFDEARQWAQQGGFQSVTRTRYVEPGWEPNAELDKRRHRAGAALDKYRTVCRPGFGMLCRRRDERPHNTAPAAAPHK